MKKFITLLLLCLTSMAAWSANDFYMRNGDNYVGIDGNLSVVGTSGKLLCTFTAQTNGTFQIAMPSRFIHIGTGGRWSQGDATNVTIYKVSGTTATKTTSVAAGESYVIVGVKDSKNYALTATNYSSGTNRRLDGTEVTISGNALTVSNDAITWTLEENVTPEPAEPTFDINKTYYLHDTGINQYVVIPATVGSYVAPSTTDKTAVKFTAVTGGYSIKDAATGNYIGIDSWNAVSSATAQAWEIAEVEGGITIKNISGTYAGKYFGGQSGKTKFYNNNESAIVFEIEEANSTSVEYTVNITGAAGSVTYDGHTYNNGDKITATGITSADITALVVDGFWPANVVVNGDAINVTYKAYPFQAADSFGNIQHWYALNIHSNQTHYIYTDNGAIAFNNNNYSVADAYAWGFVGNNTTGYVIYNKATGETVALDSADPCAMTAAGLSTYWTICATSQTTPKGLAGFCIKTGSQQYVNYQSGLKRWGANDAGSTFTPYELDFSIKTYTIHITGATGATVTYQETQYSDGDQIIATGIAASELTATTVEGYNVSITIDGTDINVVYTEKMKTNQLYVFRTAKRGGWIMDENQFKSTAQAGVEVDASSTAQQFAVYQYEGKYYLWSQSEQHFLNNAGQAVSILEASPVEWSEHDGGQTYFFHFTDAAEKYININGDKNMEICYWSYADEGNKMYITPVEGFDAAAVADVIAADLTPASIEITIGETGYATMAYDQDFVKPEGLKVYYCIDEDQAGHLSPVEWDKDYLPASAAYILEGTPGNYTFNAVASDFEYPEDDYEAVEDVMYENALYGNFEDTATTVEEARLICGSNIYVFSKANGKMGFYRFAGTTLAPHKAFYATEEASVQGFILDFEGTEGINTVMNATNLKAGYDLQGRSINKVQKGINILDGKKIIK